MKIYVASSWRNPFQPAVVEALRADGHVVYDFRHPKPGDEGFRWTEIDEGWESWDSARYVKALSHPVAEAGFKSDKDALDWCDACVLVLPCGRSAHLELGYVAGAKKRTAILMPNPEVPMTSGIGGHSWDDTPCPACGEEFSDYDPPDPEPRCFKNILRVEPELMNKLADRVCLSLKEVREWLGS